MRTHILIFGTTGAGKTVSMVSIAYNALVQGSGLIYVDGKGAVDLYTKIFSMTRAMGRDHDLLCINYMTGAKDVIGPQVQKLSNTLNPFAQGSAGGLTQLLVSLMDGGDGGGDMWKGRAISLISAIMLALIYMRDQGEILLDVDMIREYLILDNIIKLYKDKRAVPFPPHIRNSIKAYLVSLPGFQEKAEKQSETVLEQHGFLQMQFTRILGSLADDYGFIFKTNLGEVNFRDVVLKRRILVVLLPALEKSTDELKNLGKIIVGCLKQMMASTLGADLEGSFKTIIETRPTNAKAPFLTILDEYGYYATPGSAVMPAQARSLGFSMVFAGQDFPAFAKAGKEEADSIIANCSIKICMKMEDPDSTFALFDKSAGEAMVANINQMEKESGVLVNGFVPSDNASIQSTRRVNMQDLKEQDAGQAHIFFRSTIVRADIFFANPADAPNYIINSLIPVEPPEAEDLQNAETAMKTLLRRLTDEVGMRALTENLGTPQPLAKLRKLMDQGLEEHGLPMHESACSAVALWAHDYNKAINDKLSSFGAPKTEDDTSVSIFSRQRQKRHAERAGTTAGAGAATTKATAASSAASSLKSAAAATTPASPKTASAPVGKPVEAKKAVAAPARPAPSVLTEDDEDDVFIDEASAKTDYAAIYQSMGQSEAQAQKAADKTAGDLKQMSNYPPRIPPQRDPEEIADLMKQLQDLMVDEEP